MKCSSMVADSKMKKKLGHNLTVKQAVLLPETRLRTTAGGGGGGGLYCKVYTLRL